MDTMKAIVCPKYGTPDVLQLKEVDKPHPEKTEVLIKIHSSTVTSGDCRIISFRFAKWFWLPGKFILGFTRPRKDIPGWELSGIVEKVGSEVAKFKEGDSVFGFTDGIGFGGTNAEYKCISQSSIVHFNPKKMQYDQAAVLSIGGLTALHFLRKAGIKHGHKVLINGASGSVGTYAVQIAKSFGAEVTGVCSGRNIELVRSLGADHVIDYTVEDFAKNGESYDVIFDAVDKVSFKNCKSSLSEEGS
jgi:NADPH:quinone reductase-like Zn-dependent oxidoreductase